MISSTPCRSSLHCLFAFICSIFLACLLMLFHFSDSADLAANTLRENLARPAKFLFGVTLGFNIFGYFCLVFWFPAEHFCGWLSTLLGGLLIGLSLWRYAFAPLSRDYLGRVDVKPGIASFVDDVNWYVPESHFISMAAIRNFKWDSWAAWQFRWSPICALAFAAAVLLPQLASPSGLRHWSSFQLALSHP